MQVYQPTEYLKLLHGDSLECLRTLPDESVHCCVTSPPYFQLRNYGVDGQIGLEETPEKYIAKLVEVFREVRRVLRHDGTCWVNIADTYSSVECGGIKPKDLIGVPWSLAFALRADGFYLRQDCIWHKLTPMPSGVTDRCTTSHEYIFLLSKTPKYYYDADAIRTPLSEKTFTTFGCGVKTKGNDGLGKVAADNWARTVKTRKPKLDQSGQIAGANKRSVWSIANEPSKHKHFATYPKKLVRPCILAGTSQHGVCSVCLAPWTRKTNKTKVKRKRPNSLTKRTGEDGTGNHCPNDTAGTRIETLGWVPSCECCADVIPATVLDPFSGMGTTGVVATTEGRSYIGIELNQEYLEASQGRILEACKVEEGSLFAVGKTS